jgi:hypothetical protein
VEFDYSGAVAVAARALKSMQMSLFEFSQQRVVGHSLLHSPHSSIHPGGYR